MRISIVCVGKIKEKFFKDAIDEYSKRLSRYCKLDIIEVADEKTPDGASDNVVRQILQKEGERIKSHLLDGTYIISLAIEGKKYNSENFSHKIDGLCVKGINHIIFIIGGSLGIDEAIKKQSNELISFSDMTFPHQLMRVILLEQIYRAFRISNNEPYHK